MSSKTTAILNALELNSKNDLLDFSNNIESSLSRTGLTILNVYDVQVNQFLKQYADPSLNAAKCEFFNKKAANPFSKYFDESIQDEYKAGYTFGSVTCEHNSKIRFFDRNNYLEVQDAGTKFHLFLCINGKKLVYIVAHYF